jgi:DNA-binding NarL/FixJ family response regulator
MIRVLVVAERRLLRDLLCAVLRQRPEVEVLGSAGYEASALAMARDLRPDVLLVYVETGAHQMLRALGPRPGGATMVALGPCSEPGCSTLADGSIDDLVAILHAAGYGTVAAPPGVFGMDPSIHPPDLTPQQVRIVQLIDAGLSNKEIAATLGVELSTVKNHVHNLLTRLGVARRGQAAAAVRRSGLERRGWKGAGRPSGV